LRAKKAINKKLTRMHSGREEADYLHEYSSRGTHSG